jgi:hypothetical protein
MDRYRRTHCMVFMLAIFEFSEFLPLETRKTLVYAAPVDNEEAPTTALWVPGQIISNYPVIFERMR